MRKIIINNLKQNEMKSVILKIAYPFIYLYNIPSLLRELKEENKQLRMILDSSNNEIDKIKITLNSYDNSLVRINEKLKEFESNLKSVNIGTDVCPRADSWAVLSYRTNKGAVVKFFDLKAQNYRQIEDFLSRFEYQDKYTDSPIFYRK